MEGGGGYADDTAASLFGRRRKVQRVRLGMCPPLEQVASGADTCLCSGSPADSSNVNTGLGLKVYETLILSGPVGVGKTEWLYRLAATHLCLGGHVVWIRVCRSSFHLPRFLCVLESALCQVLGLKYSVLVERFGGPQGLQERLAAMLSGGPQGQMSIAEPSSIVELMSTLLNIELPAAGTATHNSSHHIVGGSEGGGGRLTGASSGNRSGGAAGLFSRPRPHLDQATPIPPSSSSLPPSIPPLLIVDGLGLPSGSSVLERQLGGSSLRLGDCIDDAVFRLHCACVTAVTTWPLSGGSRSSLQFLLQHATTTGTVPGTTSDRKTTTDGHQIPVQQPLPSVGSSPMVYGKLKDYFTANCLSWSSSVPVQSFAVGVVLCARCSLPPSEDEVDTGSPNEAEADDEGRLPSRVCVKELEQSVTRDCFAFRLTQRWGPSTGGTHYSASNQQRQEASAGAGGGTYCHVPFTVEADGIYF